MLCLCYEYWLGELRRRAALLAAAIKGDALLRFCLRDDRGMAQNPRENGGRGRRRVGRKHYDRGRRKVVRALLVYGAKGLVLHEGHAHHAVVLAVPAAACRQGVLGCLCPQERHDGGSHQKQQ